MHSPNVYTSPRRGCGNAFGLTSIATMPSENSAGTSRARRSIMARKSSRCMQGGLHLEPFLQIANQPVARHPILLQRVAIPYRDRSVRGRLAVHRDPEGRAGFVLPPVAAADRAAVVVEHVVVLAQVVVDAARQLGHPVLVDEGEHRRFERCDRGCTRNTTRFSPATSSSW